MSFLTNLRTNTSILAKINKSNTPSVGQIEYIILVPAQIKAPNFELILTETCKIKHKSEKLKLYVSTE